MQWWPIIPVGHTPYTWLGVGGPDSIVDTPAVGVSKTKASAAAPVAASSSAPAAAAAASASSSSAPAPAPKEKKEKAAKPAKAAAAPAAAAAPEQPEYSKLDIRVGQIVKAARHPDPTVESLYVEEIDVGEGAPRVIVSGLVKYIPLDVFSSARVCVICNLKPSALKGVTSQGMVLAASTGEGDKRVVELIVPPAGAKPGDRIVPLDVDYSAYAPLAVVDPKAKKANVWAAVAATLKTDDALNATWDGKILGVANVGAAKAASLAGATIA